LPHAVTPLNQAIRNDLQLDRFGYEVGPAVDTIALDAGGAHLTIGPNRVSGAGLPDADAEAWPGFRERHLAFAKALRPLLENRPPRLKNMPFADKTTLAKLGWNIRFGLGRDAMYEFLRVAAINIYDVLNDTFDDERLKAAVALDAVMGSAMGPRTPGTVLTWLQRLHGELGGPPTIHCADVLVNALARSAEAAGATIRCDARVTRILVEDDRAVGVELDGGETIESSVVVSNADPRATLATLIGAQQLDTMFANRVAQIRGSGVVAKLHLALSGLPKFEGLDASQAASRLLVAPSLRYIERAFNHSKYGEYSDEPVLEISIPSVHNASLAPEGHHVMSVNVAFMPYDLEGGWAEHETAAAEKVISLLARYAPGLESLIVGREFLTPVDIEAQFGAVRGHWHHGELSIHQSFMMRPLHGAAQYDTPVGNLFLCGAGCHPGGGLTGLPGRNAARRVLELGGAK
jgi:phytoene dehydrogenase-like protein